MNEPKPTPSSTRDRLLHVARRLFAARGFEGTSVREITGEAGANLGAITYHFGTKQALYEAVIASLIDPMRAGLEKALQAPVSPLDRIELIVRVLFTQFVSHPEQPGLMLHELARQRALPGPAQTWVTLLMTSMMRLIEEGQEQGAIVSGPSLSLAMSVISQPFFFAMTREPWSRSPDLRELGAGRMLTADLACAFIRRSLEAPGRNS